MSIRVLIPSGAGAPGFSGILNCLRQEPNIVVVAGDMSEDAFGQSLADAFEVMPKSTSPDYTNKVLEVALKHKCNVILPITTAELLPLSLHFENFLNHNIGLSISNYESLKIANNKALLYSFLVKNEMICPDFALTFNKKDFFQKLDVMGSRDRTLIMKPAEGNGSRGFRIIDQQEVVQSRYFDTKAGATLTCKNALEFELPDHFEHPMLICEYLPGTEYSVDLLANHGNIHSIAIRSRDKTVSGISVRGTFVNHDDIEKQSVSIVNKLKLNGPVGLQFKLDIHGKAKILEINPRLQGAVSSALLAGINFPVLAVKQALGHALNDPKKAITGVRFNRFWTDIQG